MPNTCRRFLLTRDDFYPDPDSIRKMARSMKYQASEDVTGYMTDEAYHADGVRQRLQQILGAKINHWDVDPPEGNGIFYGGFSHGTHKEVPGVHFDEPADHITVVIYLTPGLPFDYGTSMWQHKSTGLLNGPTRADARRLNMPLAKLIKRIEGDTTRRDRWIEVDRVGYRYNRMVAYASGMLHSATRHYGGNLVEGRLYQTFRFGVNWSTFRVYG
ncbi:MAG TPA: DUF6445 family protein [Bryobacteraceae bacterium]